MSTYSYAVRPFSGADYTRNAERAYGAGLTPCGICGKGVQDTSKATMAVVIDGGATWGDDRSEASDPGYMGCWPIGSDCHRRHVVRATAPEGTR